ncbi:hypothetical protein EI555_016993, partial [Monodon monoceros]
WGPELGEDWAEHLSTGLSGAQSLPSLKNEVVPTCPTIRSNVEKIVLQKTHFFMWDIRGEEALCSAWNTYYSNAETAVSKETRSLKGKPITNNSPLLDVKDSMTTVEISQFLTLSAMKNHPWHMAHTGLLCPHRGKVNGCPTWTSRAWPNQWC